MRVTCDGTGCFPLNPVSPAVLFAVVICRLQWERWHSSWLKRTNTAGQSSICLLCFCSRNKQWWDRRERKKRNCQIAQIFCESLFSLFVLQCKCFFQNFHSILMFSLDRKCRTEACLEVNWSTTAQKVLLMNAAKSYPS